MGLGHSPSPARPSGVGTIADGCVAALGNMPDIPCGLRLAVGDCAHSESHLFMGQDTSDAVYRNSDLRPAHTQPRPSFLDSHMVPRITLI